MNAHDSNIEMAMQRLALVEKMRQDFVANVSHELRTPLTVIRGYLEILVTQCEVSADKWQPIFNQMFSQSLRMEQLIADLLMLSKLETDVLDKRDHRECDIVGLLKTIVEEAKTLSSEREHTITLQFDDDLGLICNRDEIRSAISNLVFNAVKYTPPKGSIAIYWERTSKGGARCMVQDTGIGIESHHIPRLTERFYRVDKARSREKGGTGLGLAIVKHVLLRHEASLEINSDYGKGSFFVCQFPSSRVTVAQRQAS